LGASPGRVAPGESFELDGRNFFSGCEDVIIDGEPVDRHRPEQDVEIELRQVSRVWDLATVGAGENHSISMELTVPEGAKPGMATVTASGTETRVRVAGG
jgi:hypothetical protein